MLEQISENDSGILNGNVLGHPSNWRTAKIVAKFTNTELVSFGVEGIGYVSASSPMASSQTDVTNDDRGSSDPSSSGWNDPDVTPTPSQNRASTSADPEQNGIACFHLPIPMRLASL